MPEHDLDRDSTELLLDHLERRRSGLEQAQWQAPALTVAAQAFLLPVLGDAGIDSTARLVILLAGVAAVAAALLSLLRLRSREAWFSEVFARYSAELIPDIRASGGLEGKAPERVNRRQASTELVGAFRSALRALGSRSPGFRRG